MCVCVCICCEPNHSELHTYGGFIYIKFSLCVICHFISAGRLCLMVVVIACYLPAVNHHDEIPKMRVCGYVYMCISSERERR